MAQTTIVVSHTAYWSEWAHPEVYHIVAQTEFLYKQNSVLYLLFSIIASVTLRFP